MTIYRSINALAEAVNSLYKTELIRGPGQGPWRNVDDVELATLSWVHWHNTARLHGYLADMPPAEFEAAWRENEALGGPQSPANTAGGITGGGQSTLSGAVGIK